MPCVRGSQQAAHAHIHAIACHCLSNGVPRCAAHLGASVGGLPRDGWFMQNLLVPFHISGGSRSAALWH